MNHYVKRYQSALGTIPRRLRRLRYLDVLQAMRWQCYSLLFGQRSLLSSKRLTIQRSHYESLNPMDISYLDGSLLVEGTRISWYRRVNVPGHVARRSARSAHCALYASSSS